MLDLFSTEAEVIQFSAVFFGSLNIINSGMVYAWPSTAFRELLNLQEDSAKTHLTYQRTFWISIAPFFASILAYPLSCKASNYLGPKRTTTLTCFPYLLSWVLLAISKNTNMLFLGRAIAGISDVLIFSTFPVYVQDIMGGKGKTKLYAVIPISFLIGVLLMSIVGNLLKIRDAASLASLIPFVSLIGILVMPESPYHLIRKDKVYQAKESLRFITEKDKIDERYNKIKKEISSEKHQTIHFSTCCKIVGTLITAQQLTGITALVFFNAVISKEANNSYLFDSKFCIVLFSLLLSISLMNVVILEKNDYKFFLIVSVVGCGISLLLQGLYFQYMDFRNDTSVFSWIPVATMLIFVIFFGMGLENIPFIMINQIFLRSMKTEVLSLSYALFAFLSIIVCVLFSESNVAMSLFQPYYIFAGCCLVSLILIIVYIPDIQADGDEEKYLLDSNDSFEHSYDFLISSFEISDYSD